MATEQILQLLILERDKLDRAIEALGGTPARRRGRPPKAGAPFSDNQAVESARRKRVFTAEQKQAQAERMKAYWAKRKKAAKQKAV